MARITVTSGVILHFLWLLISIQDDSAMAFLSRSPLLCMSIDGVNGGNKIDSSGANRRQKQLLRPSSTNSGKTLLSSVSTSPSPRGKSRAFYVRLHTKIKGYMIKLQ